MHSGRELMGSEKFSENYGYLNQGLEVLDRILIAWDKCDEVFTEVSEDARRQMRGCIAHRILQDVKRSGEKYMIHRALLDIREMLDGIKEVCRATYLH